MNRREIMAGAAATAMVAATPAMAGQAAKIIGVNDQPYRAQKFSGPGWYFIAPDGESFYRKGFWIEEDGQYLRCSEGPDGEVVVWFGARSFDRMQVWRLYSVDEIDRKNGTGRYANA